MTSLSTHCPFRRSFVQSAPAKHAIQSADDDEEDDEDSLEEGEEEELSSDADWDELETIDETADEEAELEEGGGGGGGSVNGPYVRTRLFW